MASEGLSLQSFLQSEGLESVCERLKDESIESILGVLFGADGRTDNRPALLKWLAQHGLSLPERQAVAKAFNRASREGVAGIAESDAEIAARTSWLDGTSAPDPIEEPWAPPTRPFLVFTSAGDASSGVGQWMQSTHSERDFELCVVYYGDEADPACLQMADHSIRHRGGKFPNLVHALRRQLPYFRAFEAIAVWDDDVGITGDAISECFRTRRQHDYWVVAPANSSFAGKADIGGLRAEAGGHHRTTNFVEVSLLAVSACSREM